MLGCEGCGRNMGCEGCARLGCEGWERNVGCEGVATALWDPPNAFEDERPSVIDDEDGARCGTGATPCTWGARAAASKRLPPTAL